LYLRFCFIKLLSRSGRSLLQSNSFDCFICRKNKMDLL